MANQSASVSIVGSGIVTATAKERDADATTIIGIGVCQVSLPTIVKAKPKAVATVTPAAAPPLKALVPPTFPPHYSVRRSN